MVKQAKQNQVVEEFLPTDLGYWHVFHDNRHLHHLVWVGWARQCQLLGLSDFALKIQALINVYVDTGYADRTVILPDLEITPFQYKVFQKLCTIPIGQTETYGRIAKKINSSPRAVGQACRSNPIQLFIPCHRVVGKTGLGGYMGKQKNTDFKSLLLNHEAKLLK